MVKFYHSTSQLQNDAAENAKKKKNNGDAPTEESKAPASKSDPDAAKEGEEDEIPEWQNPLHHNDPKMQQIFAEDFAEGEPMIVQPMPPFEDPENSDKVLAPEHLHAMADEIVQLSMIEMAELVKRIGDHYQIPEDVGMMMPGASGGGAQEEKKEEEVKEEKTSFDIKLTAFDAKAKIKVIKEVRSVSGLGLKEAKELVENCPKVLKKEVKMEEAEEIKAKIEAIGGTVEIV